MQALAILLATLAIAPVCGDGGREAERRQLVLEINLGRLASGREILLPHPVLCDVARWRAEGVEASGRSSPTLGILQQATRRFYRAGYPPHAWIESTLIADPRFSLLLQWQDVKPQWLPDVATGDWQHIGVATGDFGALEVVTGVVGLPKCTAEERRLLPLRNLAAVRRGAREEVNRMRSEHGLDPVATDARLDAAAQAYAEEMRDRGFYQHVSPEGARPFDRAAAAGWTGSPEVGENIAKGLFTPDQMVDRWMNSSGHRKNILRPEARVTGLGMAIGPTTAPGECFEVVWVQMFAPL